MTVTLAPAWPVYEIGPPEAADAFPDRHVTDYDTDALVPVAAYGLPHVGDMADSTPPAGWTFTPCDETTVHVPLDQLTAGQPHVHAPHVANLATIPGDVLAHADAPVEAERFPDGRYWIGNGHHRACAALLRGDATLPVLVIGTWHTTDDRKD